MSDLNNQMFVSPFLNFDPSLLVTNPKDQYLHLDGTDERSRFERSCCEIGGMIITGGAIGVIRGIHLAKSEGIISNYSNFMINRINILNHAIKAGGGLAQRFGTIGLIYAICDALIHKTVTKDDDLTTLGATTSAGLIFTSPNLFVKRGWIKTAVGGAVGFGFGCAYVALLNIDRIKAYFSKINNYY